MRFQNLQGWLSWQEMLHPQEIDLGLERVKHVLDRLDLNPIADTLISVAGTNGKGSSIAMLDSIYRHAGYGVGAYTSPHLIKYNERIRINGFDASDEQLCQVFEKIDQARGDISLSYFEFSTLAAFYCFAEADLDVALLEVGLGGRLDAVNVISADAALLTSIDLDHMDWLGDTREEIGFEKAGIFREGRVAVVGDLKPPDSVLDHAATVGADLQLRGRDFAIQSEYGHWQWSGKEHSISELPQVFGGADQQANNVAAVIAVVQALQSGLPVSKAQIVSGLGDAHIAGRFQEIRGPVPVFLDTAHNPAAARALRDSIVLRNSSGEWHAVFAVMADKNIAGVIETMSPVIASWHLVRLDFPRAATAEQVFKVMGPGVRSQTIMTDQGVLDCVEGLIQTLPKNDCVVVFGSFLAVAEFLARDSLAASEV